MRKSPSYLPEKLTSPKLLARNTIYNLAGQGAPIVLAVFTIPVLVSTLGTYHFGVLTFAWIFLGYFSLFDLGLGRTVTIMVAQKLGVDREHEIPPLVWTALFIMTLMGLIGTVCLTLATPWVVKEILRVPAAFQPEIIEAFYVLAFSLPIVISIQGFQGILEAHQRYDLINIARLIMGVFTYLGPVIMVTFTKRLSLVLSTLLFGRLLLWVFYLISVLWVFSALRRHLTIDFGLLGPMLRFGGWMTISNVIGPLMIYLDRFLIGAFFSMVILAYYATPYDLVTRQLLIPAAIASVMFPAFSTSFQKDRFRTVNLFIRSLKYCVLILFPLALVIVTLAYEGLDLWLGAEFAIHSTRVLQVLAIGVMMNAMAQLCFALVQGAGRPDLTAKLHFAEFPVYLVSLWLLLTGFGINGAAMAWTLRVSVDAALLFFMAQRLLLLDSSTVQKMTVIMGATLSVLVLAMLPWNLALKGIFLFTSLAAFVLCSWHLILSTSERSLVQGWLKVIFPSPR